MFGQTFDNMLYDVHMTNEILLKFTRAGTVVFKATKHCSLGFAK